MNLHATFASTPGSAEPWYLGLVQDPAKQSLRAQLLALRRELSVDDLAARSAALTHRLVEHPLFERARGIAAFVGVRNEPDTRALLDAILAAGKSLWLPRLTGPGQMQFFACADLATLEPGRMGLREPPWSDAGVVMPGPDQGVDVMLVPGLGFGRDGARIGFGAGHYDRAFATRAGVGLATLVGVCLSEFLDPFGQPIPTAAHDHRVDWVATELGLERCGAVSRIPRS